MATLIAGPNNEVAKNTVLFTNMPGFIAKALKVYRTVNGGSGGLYQAWTAPGGGFDDFNGVETGKSYTFIMSAGGTFDDLGLPNAAIPDYAEPFNNVAPTVTTLQLQEFYPTGQGKLFRNGYLITSGVNVNTSTGLITFQASGSSGPDDYVYIYPKGAAMPKTRVHNSSFNSSFN